MFFRCAPFWRKNREVYPFLAKPLYFIFLYLILGWLMTTEIRFFALSKQEKGTR